MTVDGLDLSVANDAVATHLDDIDPEKIYAAGKRFVYLKATEAENYVDPQFLYFVNKLSTVPLRLGAYTFARCDENPADDVDGFLAATESVKHRLTLAPVFDLEVRSNRSAQQILDYVCGWAARHILKRGCGILLYSYTSFLRSLVAELGGPASPGALELRRFPLFVAQYTRGIPDLTGLPWPSPTIHQWAASDPKGPLGTCPGVNGYVDLDRFYGTEADLDWIASLREDGAS